ncbi:putative ABC transport system permease protein [Pedobacter sp. UYEF25]
MFKNHLKIAWRNLIKHKTFSIINISGLAIGLSICFIILLYVQNELSYDRFNKQAGNIARIAFKAEINGGKIFETNVMPPVAQALKNDYPEVQDATRLQPAGARKVTYKEKSFKDDELAFVDANFFSIFTLPIIAGDGKTALQEPNTIIVTKVIAKKYFGNENPIGKILSFPNDHAQFKVTGVIDEVPVNAHFHFDMFASMASLPSAKSDSWMVSNFFTYLLLKPDYDYKKLEAKLPEVVKKYMGPQIQQTMGISLAQFITKGNQMGFILQPLTSIHLNSHSNYELDVPGNAMYVYVFGVIAVFILLIACINFVNLSTASAAKRAKEVGVRKVIGSTKIQLMKQFLVESALVVSIALFVALIIIQLMLPLFNTISEKHLSFGFNLQIIASFIGLGALVSIIAGIYPAFFLSSFKPIATLKGKLTSSNNTFGLRSGLVIFQFFISVGLIIGTVVVRQQMKYIQNKNLGYDKEQLLSVSNSYALGKNEQLFKAEMLRDPRVVNATVSSYKPAGPSSGGNALSFSEGHENQIMKTQEYHIDEQYIPTFGMKMASGRNFQKTFSTDSTAIIINETAAKAYGWNNLTAVGKTIIRQNSDRGSNVPYHVIGVVKDFNFQSLHEPITPLLMTLNPDWGLIFKVKTTDIRGLLSSMRKRWGEFNTDEPFTYTFMDDLYKKTYLAEEKTETILNIFSMFTILVACLGLFGLVTYTAEQRSKEIGIRKVLGASVNQLVQMLSKDLVKLVFIACLFAFPFSYWVMNKWLQGFAFRIGVSWWIFIVAGIAALLIALITVSFQAIKAALSNPIKSLRTE